MVVSRLEGIIVQAPGTYDYNDVSDYMEEMVNFVDEKLGAGQRLKPDKYFAEFKDWLSDSCKNPFGIQ
jgi:molybdate-binding protein